MAVSFYCPFSNPIGQGLCPAALKTPLPAHHADVQQEYVISNDGDLFPAGKTFSTNFSIDTLDKNKASHRKLARAMKASALVSGNDYTAFIWNEGKRIRVYSYHV